MTDDSLWRCVAPIPEPTLFLNRDNHVVYANPAARRFFGRDVSTEAFDIIVKLPSPDALRNGWRSKQMVPGALVAQTAHGDSTCRTLAARVDSETLMIRLLPREKNPSAFELFTRQIDELAVENARRRAAESRLVSILDGLPFGLWLTHAGKPVLVNDTFRAWFGDAPPIDDPHDGLEIPLVVDDENRIFVIHRFVTSQQDDVPIDCIVYVDITDRKRAEAERETMQQSILHAQKLESLGVLAGGIAHDFNNLLVAVLGNADLALTETKQDSRMSLYLGDIVTASQRAAELCRQMLAYSGKGRFVVQPVALNEIVREMLKLLEVSISKRAALKFRFTKESTVIEADVTQIRQIMMNIITNASDAPGVTSDSRSVIPGSG